MYNKWESVVGGIMRYENGNPCLQGCSIINGGYNFTYDAGSAVLCKDIEVKLCIYDKTLVNIKYEVELKYRMGTVYSIFITDDNLDDCYYCYKIGDEYITDPYAKAVTGCEEFGKEKKQTLHISPIKLENYDWQEDRQLNIPYEDSIIYKLNVRGFTKSKTSKVKAKGTFAGIMQKAKYLKELGITAIELMPAYEFDEIGRFLQFKEEDTITRYGVRSKSIYENVHNRLYDKVNYWGYTKGFYFAPKASFGYAKENVNDYIKEFKDMVKCLHSYGIEVIMEFFFDGTSTSVILDCIRYWVREYHIDGAHIYCDEASLAAVAKDSQLAATKIITVSWNGNKGVYKHIASCNNDAQNVIRRFLKGDEDTLKEFINVCANNPSNAAVINYVTNNNGFTLYDLVSYERKHNELNGENNRDGENYNFSWNCGEEGNTRKLKVKQLRLKQIKNALAMVILSQGTPLILAGDEFTNSQQGNNNPYCVDNEISWVNWKNNEDAMQIYEWTRLLINIRKQYGILHSKYRLSMSDSNSYGYPDVSYHSDNAWYANVENYCRQVGIMYSNTYADKQSRTLIYIAYNMHWEAHKLALPKIEGTNGFEMLACSCIKAEEVVIDSEERKVIIPARSVVILTAQYIDRKSLELKKATSKNEGKAKPKNKNTDKKHMERQ